MSVNPGSTVELLASVMICSLFDGQRILTRHGKTTFKGSYLGQGVNSMRTNGKPRSVQLIS
jgi:hypothetical protein